MSRSGLLSQREVPRGRRPARWRGPLTPASPSVDRHGLSFEWVAPRLSKPVTARMERMRVKAAGALRSARVGMAPDHQWNITAVALGGETLQPVVDSRSRYPAVSVETDRVPRSLPVSLIKAPTCVSRCVSTPRITSFRSMRISVVVGASPSPIAGQDTHGTEQSSYQVTDAEPGNARGTPEPERQVNARAARPIPARVRSDRRSQVTLD
jgi:hypothetical protein